MQTTHPFLHSAAYMWYWQWNRSSKSLMCSLVLLHGIRTNVTAQTVLIELEGQSTKSCSTHFFISVFTLVGELAGDFNHAKNIGCSGKNWRVGLFLEFQHFNKENRRTIVNFKTDLTKNLWEFIPWRGAEPLNRMARRDGAEESVWARYNHQIL